jgi:hypothetical protein
MEAFRVPAQLFGLGWTLGSILRRNAALLIVPATLTAFLLARGSLLSRVLSALRLVHRAFRWWLMARLVWRLAERR